jgi:thiol:disulfide interchange protein
MIPINLAIIGAGAEAGNRRRGMLLGIAYGAGMAAVYGTLGILVILTGAKFGTLNASPWFNAVIAGLFLIMALAMFDALHIDLSRFQSRLGVEPRKGSVPAAFVLGGVMALLAGACVAPVVISVLLFAANLYAGGHRAALLLPFLLGIGMALPWPLAGAGVSFLPKPGRWMQYVKHAFGLMIVAAAVYYGRLASELFVNRARFMRERVAQVQQESLKAGWMNSLPQALRASAQRGQPLLIDFWASWCKSCLQMEKTTFQDAAVKTALERFVKVKYRAEDLRAAEAQDVLAYFGVVGLPTYIVLVPGQEVKDDVVPPTAGR